MAIAYCTNCKANFTEPAEVASINSGPPHHCAGCAAFAAEDAATTPESAKTEEELVNDAPQEREVYAAGDSEGEPASAEDVEAPPAEEAAA